MTLHTCLSARRCIYLPLAIFSESSLAVASRTDINCLTENVLEVLVFNACFTLYPFSLHNRSIGYLHVHGQQRSL